MLSFTVYNNKQSSKWVTFIHGAGGSSSIWFRQIRSFKEEFNVLLIDLGGHGKSKSRFSKRSKQGYTFNIVTEDIVEVLEHLKIKSLHTVTNIQIIRTRRRLSKIKVLKMTCKPLPNQLQFNFQNSPSLFVLLLVDLRTPWL